MVYQEENIPNNVYLTEENQAQLSPQPIYPDISDSQWGIDTFEFWANVAPDDYRLNSDWRETTRTTKDGDRYSTFTRKYDYKGQVVSITINTLRTACYFSLNAAKLIHADPMALLDPDLLSEEICLFLESVKSEVAPSNVWDKSKPKKPLYSDWQDKIMVSRIDLARNFDLPDSSFRSHLQNIKHFGKTSHVTIKSRQDGWTVTHQTKKSGKDMLYNKTAELKIKKIAVKEGLYRFETKLSKGRKKKLNLTTLSKINRNSVWTALQSRWDKTTWGLQKMFASIDLVLHRIFGGKACPIIGYLRLTDLGITPKIDAKTAKSYQEKIDLALLDPSNDENATYNLDLYSGQLKSSLNPEKQNQAPVNSGENSE